MIDTKQRAKQILEEYANCYSEVDVKQLAEAIQEIKAEAYKEFAERLKKLQYLSIVNTVVSVNDIDNLLKELVGENNG